MKSTTRRLAAPFIVSLGLLPACGGPQHTSNPPGPPEEHKGGHENPPGVDTGHENPPAPQAPTAAPAAPDAPK